MSLVDAAVWIEVTDRENLLNDDAEPRGGGDEFTYEMTVTPLERSFAPLTIPAEETEVIDERGQVDWYEFTVPARTRLQLSASGSADAFDPWVYLSLNNDQYVNRGDGTLSHLNAFETVYRAGVTDRLASAGDDYDYDFFVDAETFEVVAEVEPNDGPPEGGQLVDVLPVWFDGALTAENAEDFDRDVIVVNLTAGYTLLAETTAGTNGELDNADTQLTLTGPGIDEAVEDDDSGYSWWSRISDFVVPETGAYEITVTPYCDDQGCRPGDYALTVSEFPPAAE
jgi:hypothetical protein